MNPHDDAIPGARTGAARITGVRGGSHGVAATYDDLRGLAATYDAAGDTLRAWAAVGARTLTDGDLLESAVLAPPSFAAAESAVLAASVGPHGLLADSLAWETDALLVGVCVRALTETDDLVHATFEALDHLGGRAVGVVVGATATGLLTAGPLAWPLLPAPVRRDVTAGGTAALEDWVVDHPGVVEHLVNGGGGLLDGLWDGVTPLRPGGPGGLATFTADTAAAAGLLALLYGPDGRARVERSDIAVPGEPRRPRGVADLVARLGDVAGLSADPRSPANGTIEVQTFAGGDGVPRHVVYLPGTDDLTTLPWTQDGDVRDMATNLLLVGGADNAYQDGIVRALHEAGVGPGEPVLLAGHSMGGMEAAAILGAGGDLDVTDVVTVGSPTAQVEGGFPPGTHVLSLEHEGDVVPLLDGEPNPDTTAQVTVQFTTPDGAAVGIVGHHDFGPYTAGAAAVDASTDPSVRDLLAGLRDRGFLPDDAGPGAGGGDEGVTSQVFQITRDPR